MFLVWIIEDFLYVKMQLCLIGFVFSWYSLDRISLWARETWGNLWVDTFQYYLKWHLLEWNYFLLFNKIQPKLYYPILLLRSQGKEIENTLSNDKPIVKITNPYLNYAHLIVCVQHKIYSQPFPPIQGIGLYFPYD